MVKVLFWETFSFFSVCPLIWSRQEYPEEEGEDMVQETAPVPATLSPLIPDILLLGVNGGDGLPSGHLYNLLFPESKHTEALSSRDALTRSQI